MSTLWDARIESYAKRVGNVCLQMNAPIVHSGNAYSLRNGKILKVFLTPAWNLERHTASSVQVPRLLWQQVINRNRQQIGQFTEDLGLTNPFLQK